MTAVEWLIEELNKSIGLTKFVVDCDEDYKSEILGIIEQAKEMEKQQIIDAFEDGYGSGYRDNGKLGSEYFDETFKNNKS